MALVLASRGVAVYWCTVGGGPIVEVGGACLGEEGGAKGASSMLTGRGSV